MLSSAADCSEGIALRHRALFQDSVLELLPTLEFLPQPCFRETHCGADVTFEVERDMLVRIVRNTGSVGFVRRCGFRRFLRVS